LLLFAVVACAQLSEEQYRDEFISWMRKYEKSYPAEEFFARFDIFKKNYDTVMLHNSQDQSYTMELNHFADQAQAELAVYQSGSRTTMTLDRLQTPYPNGSLDWVALGKVTPVKNQGQCGAVWAFTTTGAIESMIAIQYGSLIPLSEQELIDCDKTSFGCNGGLTENGYAFAMKNGLCTEADYPFHGTSGACKMSQCQPSPHTQISGYYNVIAKDENSLGVSVDIEPVAVTVDASQWSLYASGIFTCPGAQVNLDHTALVVGYGYQGTTGYWKVKNSWGTSWGEQGYIRIVIGKDACGIADEATYPYDK